MTNILIIGASGFMGHHLYNHLKIVGHGVISGTYHKNKICGEFIHLDATDINEVERVLLSESPEYIILLSGSKDVNKCECDLEYAHEMNVTPSTHILKILIQHSLTPKILFISTDYVFSGVGGRFTTTDKTCPNTNYGESNLTAEMELLASDAVFKIIRTGAVMGVGSSFFDWLTNALKNEIPVSVMDNTFFTPTPIKFLCEMIINIIEDYDKIPEQILHVIGETRMSRFEFANMVNGILGNVGTIEPTTVDLSNSLFQRDLSLVQSDYIKQKQSKTLIEYLKG